MKNLQSLRDGWRSTFKFRGELANAGFALPEALEETESLWFPCRTQSSEAAFSMTRSELPTNGEPSWSHSKSSGSFSIIFGFIAEFELLIN